MAKKKGKSPKLPKEILGIKLPKELREQGGAMLAKAAASPAAREMVAAGLTMAAAAATAAATRKRTRFSSRASAGLPKTIVFGWNAG